MNPGDPVLSTLPPTFYQAEKARSLATTMRLYEKERSRRPDTPKAPHYLLGAGLVTF